MSENEHKAGHTFSALIFSLYHMTVGNLFFAFVMGISFALLTIYTGSIVPAIFFHFLVNEIMDHHAFPGKGY
uniref:CPBP family glutamic-type intramembrane protease n=1 Tax=Peribacillus sp. FSL E2-0218 TaxID=2921364 RepID=UPI00403FA0FF